MNFYSSSLEKRERERELSSAPLLFILKIASILLLFAAYLLYIMFEKKQKKEE
jgi:hypothetical protein